MLLPKRTRVCCGKLLCWVQARCTTVVYSISVQLLALGLHSDSVLQRVCLPTLQCSDSAAAQETLLCISSLLHAESVSFLQWAFPFAMPVDVTLFKDYPNIIKAPMDFATIKAKVEGGLYKGPHPFYDDMKLVFTNARRYNPPGSDVNLMASGVEVRVCPHPLICCHALCHVHPAASAVSIIADNQPLHIAQSMQPTS